MRNRLSHPITFSTKTRSDERLGVPPLPIETSFFSLQSVTQMGMSVSPGLLKSLIKLQELKKEGKTITDLMEIGYSSAEIWLAGYSIRELKKVFKIREMTWFTLAELKSAGFSAAELKDIGYTASTLRYHGFSLKQLKKAGFTAKQMLEARVSHKDMLALGYQRDEMVDAELQSLRENSIFKRFKFQ